ncbi:MAG: AAA family ATPase [Gammaproteobacteria bacterium]|jgi:predicted ATPase|nr:AAA family ATPase [Gammaproteobacteria bacterium]
MTDAADARPIPTAWCVITGPPSAGKTTVIEALATRGHQVVPEAARAHIAELGHTPAEIAADPALQARIQHGIAARQQQIEQALDPQEPLFLDRALPDSIAYFEQLALATDHLVTGARRRYRRVFYLEGLAPQADGLRFEDAGAAETLGEAILGAYRRLGYSPERIPTCWEDDIAGAVAARLSIILSRRP